MAFKVALTNPDAHPRLLAFPPTKFRVTRPDYAHLNVLGFAFMIDTFDDAEIKTLAGFRGPTIAGLQPALLKRISSEAIASISPEQAQWIAIDSWVVMDPETRPFVTLPVSFFSSFASDVKFFTPASVKEFPVENVIRALPNQIAAFTTAQFQQLNPLALAQWDCLRLQAVRDDQLQGISTSIAFTLDLAARNSRCKFTSSFAVRSALTPPVASPIALSLPSAPAWVYGAIGLAGITLVIVVAVALVVYFYIRHAGNPNNTIVEPTARTLFGSLRESGEDDVPRRALLDAENTAPPEEPEVPLDDDTSSVGSLSSSLASSP